MNSFSLVLRYVPESDGVPVEHCVGFIRGASQTTAAKEQLLAKKLTELSIPLVNCRGQCYDGVANMSGDNGGLKALIQRHSKTALFTHCSAHRLNLAVVRACFAVADASDFFGYVEQV